MIGMRLYNYRAKIQVESIYNSQILRGGLVNPSHQAVKCQKSPGSVELIATFSLLISA